MKRRDRIVEIAAKLATARDVVARLEQDLDVLLGDDAEPAPARKARALKPEAEEASPTAPPPPEPPALILGIVTGARRGRPLGSAHIARDAQIVALRKEGLQAKEIAARLKLTVSTVANSIFRARQEGLLPKAFAPNGVTP